MLYILYLLYYSHIPCNILGRVGYRPRCPVNVPMFVDEVSSQNVFALHGVPGHPH